MYIVSGKDRFRESQLKIEGPWQLSQHTHQWAWTYSCSGALGVIDGVHIVYKDAAELLPVDKFRAFQRAGVWIQVIKDLLSIRAVINHGGWYSDLDIALLPRGLPSGSCFFATEPVRSKLLRYAKQDCDFDHPDYCRGFLNVGIFHFRKGAAFAIKAADAMEAHWLKAVGRATREQVVLECEETA